MGSAAQPAKLLERVVVNDVRAHCCRNAPRALRLALLGRVGSAALPAELLERVGTDDVRANGRGEAPLPLRLALLDRRRWTTIADTLACLRETLIDPAPRHHVILLDTSLSIGRGQCRFHSSQLSKRCGLDGVDVRRRADMLLPIRWSVVALVLWKAIGSH